jgi:predicted acyltransferase
MFAALLWAVDGRGWRRWAKPFAVLGMNAIAIYMASELLDEALDGLGLRDPIYTRMFAPLAGPYNASLLYALAYVAVLWAVAWVMYRRGWFVRV